MFVLAALIGTAQQEVAARLRASTPAVRSWGGYILVVIGSWLIVTAIFAEFFAGRFPV